MPSQMKAHRIHLSDTQDKMTITLHHKLNFLITNAISPDGNSYSPAFELQFSARVLSEV